MKVSSLEARFMVRFLIESLMGLLSQRWRRRVEHVNFDELIGQILEMVGNVDLELKNGRSGTEITI